MWTTWLPALLLLLSTVPQPSLQCKTSQKMTVEREMHNDDLRCLNDFINNVTCVWNSTARKPDTACTLHGFYQRQHKECDLIPFIDHGQNLQNLRCSLFFPNVKFGSLTHLSINITCGNSSRPAADIGDYKPSLHIKMHPPALHTFTNTTIAWSPGSPLSKYLFSYCFQLQFKRSDKIWENAESVDVRDMRTSVEISEENLEKGVVYDFRVRALADRDGFSGEWSEWSPVSSWRSTAEVSPTGPPALVGLKYGIPVVVLSCLIFFFIIKVKRAIWDCKLTPVPDPTKFLTGLNSVNNGSFQKWLHPVFPPQYFAPPQHSEDISPIEISALDKGMSYICSSPQGTCKTEVCHIYFNYHFSEASQRCDSSGSSMIDSGFVQSSRSYEPLEQHCQPGQSNFNLMTEVQQAMDEEEEDSPMEAPLHSDQSDVFPLPFPSGPALFPNNRPGSSHFPSGLAGLDLHTSLLVQSSLLNISPSTGGYMIVTDTCDSC